MGILAFVVILIIAVVIFSVQNSSPVAVSFLVWSFDASLAIVIFLSLVVGIIIGVAVALWARRRPSQERREPPPPPDRSDTLGF